jgi:hypothetical protein
MEPAAQGSANLTSAQPKLRQQPANMQCMSTILLFRPTTSEMAKWVDTTGSNDALNTPAKGGLANMCTPLPEDVH